MSELHKNLWDAIRLLMKMRSISDWGFYEVQRLS